LKGPGLGNFLKTRNDSSSFFCLGYVCAWVLYTELKAYALTTVFRKCRIIVRYQFTKASNIITINTKQLFT
jgi:hypothetical protein